MSNQKYSIIITYRNREEHLQTLLPVLFEKFATVNYEIIICEQTDSEKFKMNVLQNVGVLNSTGTILIFHDVDYIPSSNVTYWMDNLDVPIYPVKQVVFLNKEGTELSDSEIPGGYRNFKYDVQDHAGGVFILSRRIFDKMNGFNPCFQGWGCTDTDTRERVKNFGYKWKRNEQGLFFALYHPNNDPGQFDPTEVKNQKMAYDRNLSNTKGLSDFTCNVTEFDTSIPNLRWLKISDIKI